MVFQSYALYPTKTVRGNLKFGLAAAKLDRAEIERRIPWAAKLLQIEPLLDRKPAQLSGGQRQRVAIGRALVKQVGVFLFDEPLSNLDAKLRTEMRIEIKRLHQETESTIVYVTHDQIEAMTMATRIAVMNGGVIQQFGTPDEIYEKPANLFVAGFIGAPAMNIFPATVAHCRRQAGRGDRRHRHQDRPQPLSLRRRAEEGDGVMLGMRPEHFLEPNEATDDAAALFHLPVQYTEKTGADATGYFRLEHGLLAVSISPDRIGSSIRAISPRSAFRTASCTSSTLKPDTGCSANPGPGRYACPAVKPIRQRTQGNGKRVDCRDESGSRRDPRKGRTTDALPKDWPGWPQP